MPSQDLSSKTPFLALIFASYFLVLLQTQQILKDKFDLRDGSPRRRNGLGGHQRVRRPRQRAPRRDVDREAIGAVRSATGTCSDGCGRDDGAAAPQGGSRLRTAGCAEAVAGRRAGAAAPRSGRRPTLAADGCARGRRRAAGQRANGGSARLPRTTACASADKLPVDAPAAHRRAAGRASVEDDRVHQCRRAAGRTVRSAPRALPVPPRPPAARDSELALRDSVLAGALSRVSLFVFNGVVMPSLDLSSKTPFFALTLASYFLVLL